VQHSSANRPSGHGDLARQEVEVKAKIFLKEFDFQAAREALERVFREIGEKC